MSTAATPQFPYSRNTFRIDRSIGHETNNHEKSIYHQPIERSYTAPSDRLQIRLVEGRRRRTALCSFPLWLLHNEINTNLSSPTLTSNAWQLMPTTEWNRCFYHSFSSKEMIDCDVFFPVLFTFGRLGSSISPSKSPADLACFL